MNPVKYIAILLAFIAVTNATVTAYAPIADAYLLNAYPNSNYGSVQNGFMGQDYIYGPTGVYYDLVTMFNISSLPTTVTDAKIIYKQPYVVIDEIYGAWLRFNVYEIATNWTESTVTWNNPPIQLRTTATNVQDNDVEKVIIPVTGIVNDAKATGRSVIAVRVKSEYLAAPIYMLESDLDVRPVIQVTY